MAKYRKKPLIVEAELFKLGMEDGYACYPLFSDKCMGFFDKNGALPKNNRKPAIKTLEGWYEVEVDKHYIVTGVKGERYPVEKEIFEETYNAVNEAEEKYKEMLSNIPGNSSLFGTEKLQYLLKCLDSKAKNLH